MKILIITVGTRGDVQPYVALGKGLQAAGHAVTVCTCQKFESFVTEHGLSYGYINNGLLDFMHSEDGRIAMEQTSNLFEMIRTGIRLLPQVGPRVRQQISDAWKAAQQVNPDLILFHPKAIGAKDFAERLNIPCMLAFYLPMYVPTGECPAMGFPGLKIGRWYNRFTYRVINRATWLGTGKYVNEWRTANGLTARRAGRYLERENGDAIPALHAYSPSVVAEPADWPDNAAVTGYLFMEQQDDWQPPEELQKFLDAGEPPVYFGFGSIFGRDPARLTGIVRDAIQQSGVRAIIASGWGGLQVQDMQLPDTILGIESAPHEWLFPRVSAVVHHGGCGTTAAGLRAGRPSIICPFFGDQPYWGAAVHRLGVGPKPVLQRKLTAEKLSHSIRQAITDTSMRQQAERLGQQIRSEDGVANAVRFVEQWVR